MALCGLVFTFFAGIAAALPLLAFAGGTAFDADLKRVAKLAVPWDDHPDGKLKSLCVCLDADPDFGRAVGALTWDTDSLSSGRKKVEVFCTGLVHDQSNGSRRGRKRCDDSPPLTN